MLEWVYRAADAVDRIAKHDPEYQELARQQRELVGDYEALLARLSPDDRELLLEYTDVMGNMQYRLTQLAYDYGKQMGAKGYRFDTSSIK